MVTSLHVNSQMFIAKGEGSLRDQYKIGSKLGEGAFGEVRLCTHRVSHEQRAVKVLKKETMDEEEMKSMLNEIQILKNLDHPNIVKIYEYFEDSKRFYIVTDIIEGGELFDEITRRGHFTERDAAVLLKQVLSAIAYCHNNNIMHRDLKPENILLEESHDYEQAKIIDFGTAQTFDPAKQSKEQIGTPYYIAPEVLNKKYGKECDIWSTGVIAYILLSGLPPFNGSTDGEIMAAIKKGQFTFTNKAWSGVSDSARDFITKMLDMDTKTRLTAEQCLQHKWILEHSKQTVDAVVAREALMNLSSFHKNSTIKVATLQFISSQLISKKEKEDLAHIFKQLDKNGDGRLSKEELKEGYMNIYGKLVSDAEVD